MRRRVVEHPMLRAGIRPAVAEACRRPSDGRSYHPDDPPRPSSDDPRRCIVTSAARAQAQPDDTPIRKPPRQLSLRRRRCRSRRTCCPLTAARSASGSDGSRYRTEAATAAAVATASRFRQCRPQGASGSGFETSASRPRPRSGGARPAGTGCAQRSIPRGTSSRTWKLLIQGAACETPGACGLAQPSILLVNTHLPWIADWMPLWRTGGPPRGGSRAVSTCCRPSVGTPVGD